MSHLRRKMRNKLMYNIVLKLDLNLNSKIFGHYCKNVEHSFL